MKKCTVYRRTTTGESQRVIAKKMGVSQATISAYERNFDTKKARIMKRLRILLETCPIDEYNKFTSEIKSIL